MKTMTSPHVDSDVVELCGQLLRFDTSNPGQAEWPAADYVADLLSETGLDPVILEPEPGRRSVVTRVRGRDSSRPALLVHGHLDVVPVDESGWTVDPFGGLVSDGCMWGRGAVDMKDMLAMMLATVRTYHATGEQPRRDLVLAFLADEEAGGALGAGHLVNDRPDLLAGCTAALGEVGGFSVTLDDDTRAYFVETSEKGVAWLRLNASGPGGHASMLHPDNPVQAVAGAIEALKAVSTYAPTAVSKECLDTLARLRGVEIDVDDELQVHRFVTDIGAISRMLLASMRHTFSPTMVNAGWKENVVPNDATALIDARFLPGREDEFRALVADTLDGRGVAYEFEKWLPAVVQDEKLHLMDDISKALRDQDPGAAAVPYVLSAGSDSKWFRRLGMSCYGFTPLRLPDGFDFSAQFHAPDERVPIDSLAFGARVVHRLLTDA